MDDATPDHPATLYFDLVDPVSFLLDRELTAAEQELGVRVARHGVEISPPPHPLTPPEEAPWKDRWAQAEAGSEELGIELRKPAIVPWSRKAHELLCHAEPEGKADELRTRIFRAFFEEGRDIGRVDVLVELARGAGLDLSGTKAVLDVDRYDEEVADRREAALHSGIRVIPTVLVGTHRLEGFRNRASLSTFLRDSS